MGQLPQDRQTSHQRLPYADFFGYFLVRPQESNITALSYLLKGILSCNTDQFRICHCEEQSDVAISRYNVSILLHVSMDGTRRLPRRALRFCPPRNDMPVTTVRYKKLYLLQSTPDSPFGRTGRPKVCLRGLPQHPPGEYFTVFLPALVKML